MVILTCKCKKSGGGKHKKKGGHRRHKTAGYGWVGGKKKHGKKRSKASQGRKLGQYSKCLSRNGRSAAAKAECRHKIFD